MFIRIKSVCTIKMVLLELWKSNTGKPYRSVENTVVFYLMGCNIQQMAGYEKK